MHRRIPSYLRFPRTIHARAPLAALLALLLATASALVALPALAATGTAPTKLTIQGLTNPADLAELDAPKLGWQVSQSAQSAYRVVVASSQKKAEAMTGDVWDSGKVASAKQTDVAYAGDKLAADHQYYWAVQVWDGDGKASKASDVATFHTAPTGDWSGAQPIWAQPATSGDGDKWTDYTVDADITVTKVALGLYFRAQDSKNALMWQFRADNDTLVPHTVSGGTFTASDPVKLPADALKTDTKTSVKIVVKGDTVTTSIDGKQVDERTVDGPDSGTVGVRTGLTESGTVNALKVTADGGTTLLDDDLTATNPLSCGTTGSTGLAVGTGQSCVLSTGNSDSTDWAFLRTEFTPDAGKQIASATLFATGGNFADHKQYSYKAYVNGTFAGLGPTKALGSETRFDGFDVTKLVKSGQANAIGALAYTAKTDHQRFQAKLDVTYADGSTDSYGSGTAWKGMTGGDVFPDDGSIGSSYYTAPVEDTDMSKFPTGFSKPGFDDSSWQPATAKSAFTDLTATPTGKVEQQYKSPVKIVNKGDGDYFIDFGRTWIGGAHYTVDDGKEGDKVTLQYGEVTSSANTVKYKLNTGNTYQDTVTLRGGKQTVDTWGMRVFRYAEVHNAHEPITKDNFKALALVYPFDEDASSFDSSSDNLNQVYQLAKNTVESTNVNLYTDSWTRERAPYEADAYLQQKSSLYLMNDLSLGKYTFQYFKTNRTWPTEWPIYVVLAARDAWIQTGDVDQVKADYASLAAKLPDKWLDSDTGLVGKDSGSNGCSSQTDCDIVDWPTSQRDGYKFAHYNTVVNSLSYRAYADMAELAKAVGKDDDAATYQKKADGIRKALNDKLFNAKTGAYDDGMSASGTPTGHYALHASAFALAFDVPTDDTRSKVADYVADKGMVCSVYCAGFSIPGLFASGRADAAVDQLTATGTSSWMNMIKLGAGATAEAWDPSQKSNLTFSHPWAASPAFDMPAGLFGIQPKTAGYGSFTVSPSPGGLDHARVTVPSVKGTIGAAFSHASSGDARVLAQVPGNTTADVSVPLSDTADTAGEAAKASAGTSPAAYRAAAAQTRTVYLDGRPVTATVEDGVATVADVPTGCHVLTPGDDAGAFTDKDLAAVCQAEAAGPTPSGSADPSGSATPTGTGPTATAGNPQDPATTSPAGSGSDGSGSDGSGAGSGSADGTDDEAAGNPGDGSLPFTGASGPLWIAAASALLIAAGVGIVIAARRRRG